MTGAAPTTGRGVRRPSPGGRRLTAVLLGIGLLMTAGPVVAAPRTSPEEGAALALLERAARASGALSYSGTKYVASWRASGAATSLVDVRHDPGGGMVLTASPTAARTGNGDDELVVAAARLDDALLDVLRENFELRLAGDGRCTGRTADLVEARRTPDLGGTVAGRFWIDRESGLLLRREVFDEEGRRLRSSAFVDLELSADAPLVTLAAERQLTRDTGAAVSPRRLAQLRDDGWPLPEQLPGGFVLFESRSRDHDGAEVLHLAYSDGLSTTSLFVQPGSAGSEPPDGFATRDVAGHQVWAHDGAPARLVWAGGGRVWTLVSDAPESAVFAAVEALPHDAVADQGVRARFGRGVSRLGGWLNPFG
jgi:sigma-E factor negative regulatory protein RseB